MKLAFICTEKLPVPPVAGGAIQLYIEGILPYLSKLHDITVYSIKYPGLPDEEEGDNVRYVRVPARNQTEYVKGLKLRLDDSFDLIHVFNRPKWILSLGREFPEVRFSLSLHNEMFHTEKISDTEARECVERVEFINTVSKFIADGVIKRVPDAEGKLNVVYSGADIDKYKPNFTHEGQMNKIRLKEKLGIGNYKVILSVGRLSVKKGIHVLMQAVKKVMDQNPNVALVVVGSKWYGKNEKDDYTQSLENISREMNGPIIFTGFLPPSVVPPYYNLGDVFVCASQWNEPLARVHYEAMAAGLPIITTNRGGNAEVVEMYNNGLIVDNCSDPGEFRDHMNYLLLNPEKAEEMGERGRRLAEEKYNWERVAGEVLVKLEEKSSYMRKSPEKCTVKTSVKAEVKPSDMVDINAEDFFAFDLL